MNLIFSLGTMFCWLQSIRSYRKPLFYSLSEADVHRDSKRAAALKIRKTSLDNGHSYGATYKRTACNFALNECFTILTLPLLPTHNLTVFTSHKHWDDKVPYIAFSLEGHNCVCSVKPHDEVARIVSIDEMLPLIKSR